MNRLLLFLAAANIAVSAASVREPIPPAGMTSAYLTLTNRGDQTVSLIEASSDAAGTVEMHAMKTVDGMMSMRRTKAIAIPPHSTIRLEPGGLHLMLIGLTRALRHGETVEILLRFDDGTAARAGARVKGSDATRDPRR